MLKLKNIQPIWFILILALILRIPLLNGSFWLDEAAQALESARPLSQQFDIIGDFQPPLMHLFTFLALLMSQQEWWARLITALIPGLISIGLAYTIGKKLFNQATGLITALLLATSSFHIFYAQELRPYSLALMWAMFSWLALITVWNQLPRTFITLKSIFKNWWPYILVTTLGLFTSYTYPFIVLAQLIITLLLYKKQLTAHLIAACTAGALFLPWLPTFLKQLHAGQLLRSDLPGWSSLVSFTQLKALPLVMGKLVFGVIRLDVNLVFISLSVVLVLLILLLAIKLWQVNKSSVQHFFTKPNNKNYLLSFLALSLPLLLGWLVSFVVPVIHPKRFLFIQPFIYLFISSLVVGNWQLKQKFNQVLAVILLSSLLIINVFSTVNYYQKPDLQRENWRQVYQLISARFPERDTLIVFGFNDPFAPWEWYAGKQFPTLSTGYLHSQTLPLVQEKLKPATEYQFVLVFDYLRDYTDPYNYIPAALEEFGYELYELIDQKNIGFIRVYIKNKTAITG